MDETLIYIGLAAAAGAMALPRLLRRLELSRAKHPSLSGHARLARRIAALIPFYAYSEENFFASDDAPIDIAARRRAGFERLAATFRDRFPRTLAPDRRGRAGDLGPAVHVGLPRAVPVPGDRAPPPADRRVLPSRPPAPRSRTSTAIASTISPAPTASTSSATSSTRPASPKAPPGPLRWARCWAPTTRRSPATSRGCARSRGSTKSPFTCPAPRR